MLEKRVGDIEVMLGQPSLRVPQSPSLYGQSRRDALGEQRSAQPQEHDARHSNAASSSSRQPLTTLRADNHVPTDLELDLTGDLDQLDGSGSDTSSSSFGDFSTPSSPAARQAEDGSPQSHTTKAAERDCVVCLDAIKYNDLVRRCHGCLESFHADCIHLWVEQCREMSRNGTCPCWSVPHPLSSISND